MHNVLDAERLLLSLVFPAYLLSSKFRLAG
jgi:hypothetical protein